MDSKSATNAYPSSRTRTQKNSSKMQSIVSRPGEFFLYRLVINMDYNMIF